MPVAVEDKYTPPHLVLTFTITAKDGVIKDMEYCSPDPPIKVTKGDKIKLQANYDLTMHPARKTHHGGMAEQMALMAIYFTGPNVTGV
jgi:hypothetical protein